MTRSKSNPIRRQYRLVHFICTVLFCIFTFSYLYFYKGDVLAVAQHVLSGGTTSYDKLIGALVITFVLLLVHFFVHSVVSLNRWLYSLTYLPSFLLLTVLTDISPDISTGVYDNSWLWIAPIILVVYIALVRFMTELDSLSKDNKSASVFSKSCWINMLFITIMMLVVISQGSGSITLHHRAKMENLIMQGDYDKAVNVGKEYNLSDSSLTMLRAYALSLNNQLPERFFEYNITGGSKALYPNAKSVKCLMLYDGDIIKYINRNHLGQVKVANEYKLCGMLADCRLKQFVRQLPEYHSVDSILPKHYKEALVLYSHITGDSIYNGIDKDIENQFKLFDNKYSECNNTKEIKEVLAPAFARTYWYYYALKSHL